MRFLVDECTGPAVAQWLRQQNRILITNDKDFGDLVFRDRKPHKGVILLRLEDERSANKIAVLRRLFEKYEKSLPGHFIVVTETTVRIT